MARSLPRRLVGPALLVPACLLSACQPAVLQPAGPVGMAEKTILLNSLAIMLAIVVPTAIATLAFAWWFRASNPKARRLPDFAYSGRIEMITWSIPVLVILFLGGMTWIGAHQLDPYRKLKSPVPPLDIQVVSLDWKWLFIYPQQKIAAVDQMTVPVGVPLHFSLTSASVMNVFFVPRLGTMIYTMNGMSDQLNLEASKAGIYRGQSSHFSGDGFSDMDFVVTAVPADKFAAWVKGVEGKGPALDPEAYRVLERQTLHTRPFTYGSVAPGLFHMVVSQQLPPGPGPRIGRPAANVSPRTEADDVR